MRGSRTAGFWGADVLGAYVQWVVCPRRQMSGEDFVRGQVVVRGKMSVHLRYYRCTAHSHGITVKLVPIPIGGGAGGGGAEERGSAPGPRWGLCPQTPVIGSCSALAIVPPNH